METRPVLLPPYKSLTPQTLYFLNSKFAAAEDLAGAPIILSDLQNQCEALDRTLSGLGENLKSQLTRHSVDSGRVGSLFDSIHVQLSDLHLATSSSGEGSKRGMGVELQALAKEVSRVENIRNYAETALKLVALVGDIEDAVSSVMNQSMRRTYPSTKNSEDMRAVALRSLKLTEDVLGSVTKKHPQWARLISAVDHRVDRALAILRPQAIADHRSLLSSLGWPPPLSTLSSSNPDAKGSTDMQNPLFTMQGDLKQQYCESFLALCSLQELQRQRKSRQLEGQYKDISIIHQPLWAIEELVNPISIASQRHFSKWIDKPEYIFALVYKTTREYVDSMDDLLQPLVDEAMLSGYSCREEWISAMVSSLSTYLAKEIFPVYITQLEEENDSGTQSQARVSWLNLVDLMISFDKRVQSLAEHSGIMLSLQEDANMQKMSSLTVFCDRPDWLDLWAEIERSETLSKLKSQMEDDRNWINQGQGVSFISGQEDHKSPLISIAVLRNLSSVLDRCRSLPNISLRSKFVKLLSKPIINKFLDCLLQRCQEAEGLTSLTENDDLTKVAKSINAARYFESVLKEWSEDVFFLEMGLEIGDDQNSSETPGSSIFDEDIKKIESFRNEWIEKLSTVVLRGFDARCRDYFKNKKQWHEKNDEALSLSRSFIGAMDYLQGKMSVLQDGLNKIDFTRVWRSLAAGIDKLIFSSILIGNLKFYDWGVERLLNDVTVLFGVFGSWCLRPEGFFPKVNEGMKLLKMEKKLVKSSLISEEMWLKENGIRHLTTPEIEKIVKNRVFSS